MSGEEDEEEAEEEEDVCTFPIMNMNRNI